MDYDFSGWATRSNVRCSDGRIIMKDAFKDADGQKVPLVWNHSRDKISDVLGHAILESREDGVYAYGYLNDTEDAEKARKLLAHGDISALSIYANHLQQQGTHVTHGTIREVSLVMAGANPGAYIDSVIRHGEESDEEAFFQFVLDDGISMAHSDEEKLTEDDETNEPEDISHSDETEKKEPDFGKIIESMTPEQKALLWATAEAAEAALEKKDKKEETSEGGDNSMKHNAFDESTEKKGPVLSHSDEETIISLARNKTIGTLKNAMAAFAEQSDDELIHGVEDIESLFPEHELINPGAPETITRDQGWVSTVMNGLHKSPISRIRTRMADARNDNQRAFGYKKGNKKKPVGNIKLLGRTTDPQTVYITESVHRDDMIDITDFSYVNYIHGLMRQNLNEELAMAIMVGDGRDEGDEHKIHEQNIHSIWNDDDLYTIHYDVDIEAARKELQGTNTGANFGENYIYAEALITASLYSREQYKGSGNLAFFCTPHLLNVMLLARDLNGRRIYDSKTDLGAALNVSAIHTVEQFEGLVRTDNDGKKKKLLGIFVNLADYRVGATKGGEITQFEDFDIDFNQYKYLIETRLSGALTKIYSAIALEEPVSDSASTAQLSA